MKKYMLIVFILIITLSLIYSLFNSSLLEKEDKSDEIKSQQEEDKIIEFSYNVSTKGKITDTRNVAEVKEDIVTIKNDFAKPTPCNRVNYTVKKEGSIISIIPEDFPNEEGSLCIAVISKDSVEINLNLEDGNYTINLYSWWNKETPFITKEIEVGTEINEYKKCIDEIEVEKYVKGDVLVSFKEETTEYEKQEFETELGLIKERRSNGVLVKVEEGKELEWICKIKDFRIVKYANLNAFTYAS